MYYSYQWLDTDTVMVIGYDVDQDPDYELCATYKGEETEQKVHLLERHRRGAGKLERQNCEDFRNLDKGTQKKFDRLMPKFIEAAMHAFAFKEIDENLPNQLELPE